MKFNRYKKKVKIAKEAIKNSMAYFAYYHMPIQSDLVFVNSRDGKDFAGNLLRMVQELSCGDYGDLKFVVWIKDRSKWNVYKEFCDKYSLKNVRFCCREAIAVVLMECAKYILLDSGMPWGYVKREGQIVLNTWHGTPLKHMGRSVYVEKKKIANIQRNFLSCDYLVYPNEFMRDTMLDDYMVRNVYSGKVLMNGYPRNSVFYDSDRRKELRKDLGYGNKRIYAYMPTHRGNVFELKNSEQLHAVTKYLTEIDKALSNDEVFLVKLHIFNQSKIDFSQYKHIIPFPDGYETYDVLNTVDCLITDYSSVFFDYANTRNKIILFAYDKEEYFEDRGTYFQLEELPFPIVQNVADLIEEMHTPKTYDDQDFVDKYCKYDSLLATKQLCRHVFLGTEECVEQQVGNGKKNVLLFGGNLSQNGITSAYVSLLESLDLTSKNYYACFRRRDVDKYPERIDRIPSNIEFLPIINSPYFTLSERIAFKNYKKKRRDCDAKFPPVLERAFQREAKRCYWNCAFDHVVQFDGYGIDVNLLFAALEGKKTIVVHSDMLREVNTKGNQHRPLLKRIYSTFDNTVLVSEDILKPTVEISGREDNIVVIHNQFPYLAIRKKAEQAIEYQKGTEIQCYNPKGIEGALSSSGYKFISIGRFSPEKGHYQLLEAFDEFCETHSDAQLFIIGGYGILHENTLETAKKLKHWKNVSIIKSLDNPMPILKKCDLFILSSIYEALPVTLCEAACLNIPVISTDIPGLHSFVMENGGYLMECSRDGILQGINDYVAGKVHPMNINFDIWNDEAKKAFDKILDN